MKSQNQGYFSTGELLLWGGSVLFILLAFLLFDREESFTFIASLIGVTSLIFSAKGNPIGQLLMVIFSIFYGMISYSFSYYGEMVTYLGMTLPMSVAALIAWLRHPFQGNKSQVEVGRLTRKDSVIMVITTALVTAVFYFILKAFHTANLLPSTISVTTSFAAVFLTYKRSPWFAFVYALNDIVLIVLWVLASFHDQSYLSVVICFLMFLINDLYGFLNWKKMAKNQH